MKICFVGLDNYPVLNPNKGDEYFGGESVQQTLLAKAFVALGYEVSMIVKDHGQDQGEELQGIRVWKTFEETAGLPAIRFFHPRITSIWKALKLANADIYYQSCAGAVTGIVARYCKQHRKKFIFRLAHDTDCMPGKQLINLWRDRKIYDYGIKKADLIAAQGTNQVTLLQDNYSLNSTVVNMSVEIPDLDNNVNKDIDILWVNNIREFKRPEYFIELAKNMPDYKFVMIGGAVRDYEELYDKINIASKTVPNLEYKGAVPYHKVNSYFLRAKIFVNTSEYEGFPNSFLQAWVRRTPVVSFFDPDNLIKIKGLGAVPEDPDTMKDMIQNMLEDDKNRAAIAENARHFVIENYAAETIAKKYIDLTP